ARRRRVRRGMNALMLVTFPGRDHCGWGSVVFLHASWPPGTAAEFGADVRQYLRDPDGLLGPEPLLTTFDVDSELPAALKDTGYRRGEVELWLSASRAEAAFLVRRNRVERWPRARELIACA
ncbi:MAG: hypothetical protein ACRDM9_09420, partial [Gaiellaceae bacterium]